MCWHESFKNFVFNVILKLLLGGYYGYSFGKRNTGNIYLNYDQFSLLTIQSSKFNNLDFQNEYKLSSKLPDKPRMSTHMRTKSPEVLNVPPKPYLSIIDFNQLTRGGLEEATKINEKFLYKRKY